MNSTSKMIPPRRVMPGVCSEGTLYLTNIYTIAPARMERGISYCRERFCEVTGQMSAVTPRITNVLMMFEPRMFVIARSVEPSATETMFTTNSGIDVPKATTVRPMTRSLIPNRLAIADAPSTSQSAPLTRSTKQRTSIKARSQGLLKQYVRRFAICDLTFVI